MTVESNDVLDDDDDVLSINSDDEEVVLIEVETHPSSAWLIVDETRNDTENDLREIKDDQINCFPENCVDSSQVPEIPNFPATKAGSRLYSLIIAAAVLAAILVLPAIAPGLCYHRISKIGNFHRPLSEKQSNVSICSRHGKDKKNDEVLFFEINSCMFRAKLYFQMGHCASNTANTFHETFQYFWNRTAHIIPLEKWQLTLNLHLRQLCNTLVSNFTGWSKASLSTSSLVKSLLLRLPGNIFVQFTDCGAKAERKPTEDGSPTVRSFNDLSSYSTVRKNSVRILDHYSSALETLYKYYYTWKLSWISTKSSPPLDNNFAAKESTAAPTGASNTTEVHKNMHQFLPGYSASYYNYSVWIIDSTWDSFKNFTSELAESIREEINDDANTLSFPEVAEAARNYSNRLASTFTEAVEYVSKKTSIWEYFLDDSCNRFLSELAKTANSYSLKAAKTVYLSLERAFNSSVIVSDIASGIAENATENSFSNLKEETLDEKFDAEAADSYSSLITERLLVALKNMSNFVTEGFLEVSLKEEDDYVLFDDLVEAAYKSLAYTLEAAQNFLNTG